MPSDVRKVSDLPSPLRLVGATPQLGHSPPIFCIADGGAEPPPHTGHSPPIVYIADGEPQPPQHIRLPSHAPCRPISLRKTTFRGRDRIQSARRFIPRPIQLSW